LFDKIKLQKTPDGKYLILAVDPQSGKFHGTDELSKEETTKRLREKSNASESDIRRLFTLAETIEPSKLIEPV
jgi:hypothetical protein